MWSAAYWSRGYWAPGYWTTSGAAPAEVRMICGAITIALRVGGDASITARLNAVPALGDPRVGGTPELEQC